MAESTVRASSFRQFLRTVGIQSTANSAVCSRSATLPTATHSNSTFYNYDAEDLTAHSLSPTRSGWLRRQSFGLLRSWQWRWFVLSGNCLIQYTSSDESQLPSQHLALVSHVVREINPLESSSEEPQKYLFEITSNDDTNHGSSRTQDLLILAAETPDDRREWIRAIKHVLFHKNGGAIFGQHLEETLNYERQKDATRHVPEIVEMCVEYLRTNGLNCEGLFRLPGRNVIVRQIGEAFDAGGNRPALDGIDVHSVASLLKAFLRELPQSIIPVEHYERVMNIITRERPVDADLAIVALSEELRGLPTANYDLLRYLCKFLQEVSCHSDVNRMTAFNLATVFSPYFIVPEVDDPALLAGTSANRITAVMDMISKFECIFVKDVETHKIVRGNRDIEDVIDIHTDTAPQVDDAAVSLVQKDIVLDAECYASVRVDDADAEVTKSKSLSDSVANVTQLLQQQISKCKISYISSATTPVGVEVLSKIALLQQQLEDGHDLVNQLRDELATERNRAAEQAAQHAHELSDEQAATANAVTRVMELQTKLERYIMKFGSLE